MATHTLTAGETGAYEKTLVASTVDTVIIPTEADTIEIGTTNGTAQIYYTINGGDPTVAGADTILLPAAPNAVRDHSSRGFGATTVKLISSGTPTYWVAINT